MAGVAATANEVETGAAVVDTVLEFEKGLREGKVPVLGVEVEVDEGWPRWPSWAPAAATLTSFGTVGLGFGGAGRVGESTRLEGAGGGNAKEGARCNIAG